MKWMDDGKTFEAPVPFLCPDCGRTLRFGTIAYSYDGESREPNEGDYGLCHGCGLLFVLGEKMEPREPSIDELLVLQQTPAWDILNEEQEKIRGTNNTRS